MSSGPLPTSSKWGGAGATSETKLDYLVDKRKDIDDLLLKDEHMDKVILL